MAGTLMHMQYNSPMALYSKEAAQEEINRATGQPSPRSAPDAGQLDLERSNAYRALHVNGQLPPDHSARLEEPVGNEYPHYKGYVDPNLQSPSFRRLQHFTGLEEAAVRAGTPTPVTHIPTTPRKSPVPQWYPDEPPVAQRDPASADERDHPLDPNFAQKIAEAERPKIPPPVVPSWANKAHVKQHRWEEYAQESQQPTATLGQETPLTQPQYYPQTAIPAPPPPPSSGAPSQRSFNPAPKTAASPTMTPTPAQFRTVPGSMHADDKWQQYYSHYGIETGATGLGSPASRRPRSVEPDSWRHRSADQEPMLKPFVAPNVEHTKFDRSAEGYRSTPQPPRSASQLAGTNFGGMYYGPQSGGYSTKRSTATSFRKYEEHGGQSARPPMYDFSGPNYGPPKQQVNIGSLVRGESERSAPQAAPAPYWAQKAEQTRRHWQSTYGAGDEMVGSGVPPSGASFSAPSYRVPGAPGGWRGAEAPSAPPPSTAYRQPSTTGPGWRTGAGVAPGAEQPPFRGESEAWRRKQEMEQEVRRRAANVESAPRPPSGTRPGASGPVEPITQKWQDASGARTKSQTQGSYLDEKGNTVNYVKEVYTSSDPGTEFSMLTQEEKKALEEPLEPGVVSRHVTSKYYKKSTYTNQSTTTTNPQPASYPTTFHHEHPVAPGSGGYRVGEVAPGLSQF